MDDLELSDETLAAMEASKSKPADFAGIAGQAKMFRAERDKRVVCCNTAEPTRVFRAGAKLFVGIAWTGGGFERMMVYGRSRGGRFVHTWMATKRLANFRFKMLCADDPLFSVAQANDGRIADYYRDEDIACMRHHGATP